MQVTAVSSKVGCLVRGLQRAGVVGSFTAVSVCQSDSSLAGVGSGLGGCKVSGLRFGVCKVGGLRFGGCKVGGLRTARACLFG